MLCCRAQPRGFLEIPRLEVKVQDMGSGWDSKTLDVKRLEADCTHVHIDSACFLSDLSTALGISLLSRLLVFAPCSAKLDQCILL